MTDILLRAIPASDLTTIRISCAKCGNAAELPLDSASKHLRDGNCPFCSHGFWGLNEESPLKKIQEGLEYLKLLERNKDLSAEFVIRANCRNVLA